MDTSVNSIGASADQATQQATAAFDQAFAKQQEANIQSLAMQTESTTFANIFQAARGAIQNMGRA